ncbi:MAG TPA: SRPBCC domain-containing protein [Mucilaginibacter sp.]|jgi:hypothetical protein
MKNQDLTFSLLVDQSPEEVFNAVNNVRGWWTEGVVGETDQLNDEFSVKFWDVHYSKQKLIEVIPAEKVVWLVTDSKLTFIKDQSEWTGTKIDFEITRVGDKTQLQFTHVGLVPEGECFTDCSSAWNGYVNNSLKDLITTGKGQPTTVEQLIK